MDERINAICSDIREIKSMISAYNKCINTNEMAIMRLDTTLADHLKSHKRDLLLFTIVISLLSVAISLVMQVA